MTDGYIFTHFAADPYFNMAFDEWMLAKAISDPNRIYLRLYSWGTGTITFGFNQNQKTAYDQASVGSTPVIRRLTGGRALYHDCSEITYSIAFSSDENQDTTIGTSLSQSSRKIAEILVIFLKDIGINSNYQKQSAPGETARDHFHKAPCFASYSKNEIVSGADKIIASAQRRYKNSFLQHGAIKINGLANHPALLLDNLNGKISNKLEAIRKPQFDLCLEKFVEVFYKYYNCDFMEYKFSGSDKIDLINIEKELKNNCLKKRKIIKQTS